MTRQNKRKMYILVLAAIALFMLWACNGCAGMQYRPQEEKPFVITDPNTAKFFRAVDTMAESIKPLTEAVEKIIESPVADVLIPQPVKKLLYYAGANLIVGAGWYLNKRKNLFREGFNELAETDELFLAESITGNTDFDIAAKQIIKAPIRKLLKKQGFDNVLMTEVKYDTKTV